MPALVVAAACKGISGSRFIFKWNFNCGERSHSESFIYMKPSCAEGDNARGLGPRSKKLSKLEQEVLPALVFYTLPRREGSVDK